MTIVRKRNQQPPVVVSMGCPSGVGPEVIFGALKGQSMPSAVIVGSRRVLARAAEVKSISPAKFDKISEFDPKEGRFTGVRICSDACDELALRDCQWGRPSKRGGLAQLKYVDKAYDIAKAQGWPLATGPVSKEAVVRSGAAFAEKFRGHTEWLEERDGAPHSVMCFSSKRLTTSLCTTHISVRDISSTLSSRLVVKAVLELVDLLLRQGHSRPRVVVCSLNPHAGEGELLGDEERKYIVPAVKKAQQIAKQKAVIVGPVGAETAYRKGANGSYDGVVAMYHDQATIPMKLLDFGGAVNITQGLSIVRTSVDHGTAYDIAGQGVADSRGMRLALQMASHLGASRRRIKHDKW